MVGTRWTEARFRIIGEEGNMSSTIRVMTIEDKPAVLEMMKVFYASPAVLSNGSDEIFSNDIDNCVNDSPYLEGYVLEESKEIQVPEVICDTW